MISRALTAVAGRPARRSSSGGDDVRVSVERCDQAVYALVLQDRGKFGTAL
jgi:hypothetical protein